MFHKEKHLFGVTTERIREDQCHCWMVFHPSKICNLYIKSAKTSDLWGSTSSRLSHMPLREKDHVSVEEEEHWCASSPSIDHQTPGKILMIRVSTGLVEDLRRNIIVIEPPILRLYTYKILVFISLLIINIYKS